MLIFLLQFLERETATGGSEDVDPVSLDLYIIGLLMTLSVLFIWESGKQCIRTRCRAREPETHVRMIHGEDETNDRRSRRQNAVRRTIERETVGLRHRTAVCAGEENVSVPPTEVPRTSLDISVSVGPAGPRPDEGPAVSTRALRDPERGPPEPSTFTGFTHAYTSRPSPVNAGEPSSSVPGSSREQNIQATQREIGVQTDFYQGLSYQQMCEVDLLTTGGRTATAIHLFPNCHALRNVAAVQRRSFCRYCITQARQGF